MMRSSSGEKTLPGPYGKIGREFTDKFTKHINDWNNGSPLQHITLKLAKSQRRRMTKNAWANDSINGIEVKATFFYAKAALFKGALSVPTERTSQTVLGFLLTLSCQDKLTRLCDV